MESNFYKIIKNFVNESEDFIDKSVLTIDLDNKNIFYYFINYGESSIDEAVFVKSRKKILKEFNPLNNFEKKLFDIVFIYNSNHNLDHKSLNDFFPSIEKYCVRGTKVLVLLRNKENIFFKRIFFNKFNLKKINIKSFKKFLVYDYFYYFYPKKLYSRANKLLNFIFKIINYLDLQRFKFFSSHVIIKYIYVP